MQLGSWQELADRGTRNRSYGYGCADLLHGRHGSGSGGRSRPSCWWRRFSVPRRAELTGSPSGSSISGRASPAIGDRWGPARGRGLDSPRPVSGDRARTAGLAPRRRGASVRTFTPGAVSAYLITSMPPQKKFAVCVDNTDYPASLEVRKIYQVLPDAAAATHSYFRIIDESGEDYLYPRRMFLRLKVNEDGSAPT